MSTFHNSSITPILLVNEPVIACIKLASRGFNQGLIVPCPCTKPWQATSLTLTDTLGISAHVGTAASHIAYGSTTVHLQNCSKLSAQNCSKCHQVMWKLNLKSMGGWMRWVMLRKQCAFTLVGCKQMVQDSGMDPLFSQPQGLPWVPIRQTSVKYHPSPILCKAIPLQHMKCTLVPEPCPEGTESGSRADPCFSRCRWDCLLPRQKVCTQADTSTGYRNAHSTVPWGVAPSVPIPCKAESLGTKCKDSVQFEVTHLSRHSKQEYCTEKLLG